MLLDTVDTVGGAERWLVSLLGARGFPLGEHRRVGGVDPRLYGEQLHVPWLIRFPDAAGRLARSGQLTTHLDLSPSLVDSIDGANVRRLAASARQCMAGRAHCHELGGHRAIRTADWCLRQNADPPTADAGTRGWRRVAIGCRLFVRPDDRWEANDVAKLCPDLVESLSKRLERIIVTMLAVSESDASDRKRRRNVPSSQCKLIWLPPARVTKFATLAEQEIVAGSKFNLLRRRDKFAFAGGSTFRQKLRTMIGHGSPSSSSIARAHDAPRLLSRRAPLAPCADFVRACCYRQVRRPGRLRRSSDEMLGRAGPTIART